MVAWVPRFDDFKSYSNIIRVAAEPETCQAKTAVNSAFFNHPAGLWRRYIMPG